MKFCKDVLFLITLCYFFTVLVPFAAPEEDEKWEYVEVRPGAHMFWWLMYSRVQGAPESRPLVIWLTGGPGGGSSCWGNFQEVGPLDWNLLPRNLTWLDHSHLLFVDSPVGSGYSYVDSPDLYVTTNLQIALDLVTMIKHVLTNVAPELAASPIYIVGESYGGKMGPEFALEFSKAIAAGEIEANLQGVIIRDGWTSPEDIILSYAQYCLQMGIVDLDGYNAIDKAAKDCQVAIKEGRWLEAYELRDTVMYTILHVTYGVDLYYILEPLPAYGPRHNMSARSDILLGKQKYKSLRLPHEEALEALMYGPIYDKLSQSVPDLAEYGLQSGNVFTYLLEDFLKPVVNVVEEILNTTNLQVGVVNGQLDLIVDTEGVMQWIRKLSWPGSTNWSNAPREPIVIDNIVEGYMKQSGALSMYWINRAGHSTFYFNQKAGYKVLQEFTGLP